jgi:tetratricopeptide (TPR) repeat protein
MLTTTHMSNFSPLSWLSYAADYALWGLNPVGYHLTNVLLHALNAVLFFFLAGRLLRAAFPAEPARKLELGAVVAALAFAVHPLRVESVAWAAERRDVLAGAFFLGTLLLYAKAADARAAREAVRLRAWSIACFTLAAMSKASVVPLPAVLLALDVYPLKRLGAGESRREAAARLLEKLPYAAISLACAALAVRGQLASHNFTAVASHGPASRLAQALYGCGFYVWKTLIPTGLCALYPLDPLGVPLAAVLKGVAVVVLVAAAAAAAGVPRRAQLALWGAYLALLSPVLGILQNGPQAVALRYSYLSCLGWAALAGAAAIAAARAFGRNRARGAAALGALSLWIVANAWGVQGQIRLWRDDAAVWSNVLERFPRSPEANMNYADALLQAGDVPGAESRARAALALAPDSAVASMILARAELAESKPAEAEKALRDALRDDPASGDAHELLGVLLSRGGRENEALGELLGAAAIQPSNAGTQANAGAALARRGRFAEAAPYYARAAELEPAYVPSLERVRADLARSLTP